MSYKSSPKTFEDFLESSIWKDMLFEMGLWLDDIRDSLENTVGEEAKDELLRLQGSARAIRLMKALPSNVLDNIVEDIERENKEEK